MLNFEVEPIILEPFVPRGTQLDFYDGKTFISVVGFLFRKTKVLGLSLPRHRCFEELNLRFYVRYETRREIRRGVVFIKELVPRRLVRSIARWIYNENYTAVPMKHTSTGFGNQQEERVSVEYSWKLPRRWNRLCVKSSAPSVPLEDGTPEHYIAEHYWGYGRGRSGETIEYRVDHPSWAIRPCSVVEFDCDVAMLYGRDFVAPLGQQPVSAFIADGSDVTVHWPKRLAATASSKGPCPK
jgi:uncharacterized protein YqjF (DUF2071 family)